MYDVPFSARLPVEFRPISFTYPNGRVLNYNYAAAVDNTISRLSSISDTSATLESYAYLGVGTLVKRAHPQPGVDLTYIMPGNRCQFILPSSGPYNELL
jgi:hypothetical protein